MRDRGEHKPSIVIAFPMKSWFGPLVRFSMKRHGTPGWLGGETRPLENPGRASPVALLRGTAVGGTSMEQSPLLAFNLEGPLARVSSYAGPVLVSRWSF